MMAVYLERTFIHFITQLERTFIAHLEETFISANILPDILAVTAV